MVDNVSLNCLQSAYNQCNDYRLIGYWCFWSRVLDPYNLNHCILCHEKSSLKYQSTQTSENEIKLMVWMRIKMKLLYNKPPNRVCCLSSHDWCHEVNSKLRSSYIYHEPNCLFHLSNSIWINKRIHVLQRRQKTNDKTLVLWWAIKNWEWHSVSSELNQTQKHCRTSVRLTVQCVSAKQKWNC